MIGARKEFMKLKKPYSVNKDVINKSQEAFEIKRVSVNGTFEVSKNRYSRSYILSDVSYRIKEYREQLDFLEQWCKIINTFEFDISISVLNRKRDLEYLKKNVMYKYRDDVLDSSRKAYNDIIWNKVVVAKNGLEQVKIVTISVDKNTYNEAKNTLDGIETSLIKDLGYLYSGLIPLSGNERLKLLHNVIHMDNPSDFNVDIKKCIYECRDWKNEMASSYIDYSKPDYFMCDDKYMKVVCLSPAGYPSSLSDDFYYELTNLSFVSVITTNYVPIPKKIVKKTLETKYMGIESNIATQKEKRRRSNDFSAEVSYKLRREKKEIEEMLDDVNDNDQNMFWVGVSILLSAESKKELLVNESTIRSIIDKFSCRLMTYRLRQREAFNSVLPLGVRQVNLFRAMFTQTACILLPFAVQELQNTESKFAPMYYGINRISKNAILENRKNLINGNGFVFGVPGGGKSFTGSKLEMGSVYLNSQDHIIVIDPTYEYYDVADAFGGEKLELSLNTSLYFNPLEAPVEQIRGNVETVIAEKSQLMQGVCEQIMEGRMAAGHGTLIDRAVRNLYRRLSKLQTEELEMPLMEELYLELKNQEEPEIREILLALELFVDGSYNIFNHRTNVDINNRFTVFGMRDLTDDAKLSGVSMLIMLENIKKRINENAKKGIATWLYIDEIHVLLNSPYSRAYLIKLFKMVRKLGGICTGITQNVCDLLKDDDTSTLISNSEYTMFLKQAAPDASLLLKTFEGMNAAHLKYVTNAQPGTGLVRFAGNIIPMDNIIEKGNPIYDIFNTNLHEKAALRRAAEAREEMS